MRLIDADELKQAIKKDIMGGLNYEWYIDHTPTVDAVEVVRCKDCKWHEYEEIGMVWCPNMVGSLGGEDGYCSWGERKEDGRR